MAERSTRGGIRRSGFWAVNSPPYWLLAAQSPGTAPVPFSTVPTASAGRRTDRARLHETSRDGVDNRRPGCEGRVMSVAALPGTPVWTEPVPPSIRTPAGASALPPAPGRRRGAHAAVPIWRAILPFWRWLTFVLAGNVMAALVLVSGRFVASALTYTVTAASINIGLAALVRAGVLRQRSVPGRDVGSPPLAAARPFGARAGLPVQRRRP